MNQGNWEIMKALEAERDKLLLQNQELQKKLDTRDHDLYVHWKEGFAKHGFRLHAGLTPEQNAAEWAQRIEASESALACANRLNGELREALDYAYEALKGYGCDCGTDEPGTCGECYLKAFFKEHPSQKRKGETT